MFQAERPCFEDCIRILCWTFAVNGSTTPFRDIPRTLQYPTVDAATLTLPRLALLLKTVKRIYKLPGDTLWFLSPTRLKLSLIQKLSALATS